MNWIILSAIIIMGVWLTWFIHRVESRILNALEQIVSVLERIANAR